METLGASEPICISDGCTPKLLLPDCLPSISSASEGLESLILRAVFLGPKAHYSSSKRGGRGCSQGGRCRQLPPARTQLTPFSSPARFPAVMWFREGFWARFILPKLSKLSKESFIIFQKIQINFPYTTSPLRLCPSPLSMFRQWY